MGKGFWRRRTREWTKGVGTEDRLYWKFGKTLPPSTVIFREGDNTREMYIVQSGRVSITQRVGGAEEEIATLGPGEIFGEMSLLTGMERSTTARTVGEVRLLEIDEEVFSELLRTQDDVALEMLRRFAIRLRDANQYAERLVLRIWRDRVVFQLLLEELRGKGKTSEATEIRRAFGIPEGVRDGILKGLEAEGFIREDRERGGYELVDREGMERLLHREVSDESPFFALQKGIG